MTSFEPIAASPSSRQAALPQPHRTFSDPSRLAPEDAYFATAPPHQQTENSKLTAGNGAKHTAVDYGVKADRLSGRKRDKERGRSGSRRRKTEWKRLLWVRHPGCTYAVSRLYVALAQAEVDKDPDNYTDPPTFLSHLQRNPRLQLYDFWPLVADSTVIVQHICSVAIFVCCFVGISQERISPVSVVSWGSAGTVLGWVFWDFWVGQEGARTIAETTTGVKLEDAGSGASSAVGSTTSMSQGKEPPGVGLGLTLETGDIQPRGSHSRSHSLTSLPSASSILSPTSSMNPSGIPYTSSQGAPAFHYAPKSFFSSRNQQRLATAKSAVLIYCALLGLSPILKSLTKSTSSDSIWAMSFWLMLINIFFFDYGGGVGVKYVEQSLQSRKI